jgi:hypothetical protein
MTRVNLTPAPSVVGWPRKTCKICRLESLMLSTLPPYLHVKYILITKPK